MDVPERTSVAPSPRCQAEGMLSPGANRSTQVPRLEKEARKSPIVDAPTVIAWLTRAGDCAQASPALFPAAATVVTPEATRDRTAVSSEADAAPPRLRLATAGELWFARTQSIPAITVLVEVEPVQPKTRTA